MQLRASKNRQEFVRLSCAMLQSAALFATNFEFFSKISSKRFAICDLGYILSNMHQQVQSCFGKPTWRNWQTRTVQVRVPRGMWVRLPPTVPFFWKNQGVNHSKISEIFCGYGITAVHQPSKLDIRVRLPLPAPYCQTQRYTIRLDSRAVKGGRL